MFNNFIKKFKQYLIFYIEKIFIVYKIEIYLSKKIFILNFRLMKIILKVVVLSYEI